ncbi:MAG TPA: LysM peptidoglycan-binding domain-containing protein [Thiothrix sp.]|nr:LysM peptidoglycan-binding domain-containing protein [Thiothrix sp.]
MPQVQTAHYTNQAVQFQTVKAKHSIKKTQKRRGGGCQTLSPQSLEQKAHQYNNEIRSASKRFGVNQALIKSVITVESCFKSRARGTSGEKGLMQLMPGTARRFSVRNGYSTWQNVHGGTQYLGFLLRRYNGNLGRAVAAYNGGEGNVDRSGGIPRRNRGYVKKVMQAYRKFSNKSTSHHPVPHKPSKADKKAVIVAQSQAVKSTTLERKVTTKKPLSVKTAKVLGARQYRVKAGDTVYEIMRQTGTPVKSIIRWNNLSKPYHLEAGQILRVAAGKPLAATPKRLSSDKLVIKSATPQGRFYTVKAGDTVYQIAEQTGVPLKQLVKTNRLLIPYDIKTGQQLRLR